MAPHDVLSTTHLANPSPSSLPPSLAIHQTLFEILRSDFTNTKSLLDQFHLHYIFCGLLLVTFIVKLAKSTYRSFASVKDWEYTTVTASSSSSRCNCTSPTSPYSPSSPYTYSNDVSSRRLSQVEQMRLPRRIFALALVETLDSMLPFIFIAGLSYAAIFATAMLTVRAADCPLTVLAIGGVAYLAVTGMMWCLVKRIVKRRNSECSECCCEECCVEEGYRDERDMGWSGYSVGTATTSTERYEDAPTEVYFEDTIEK